MSETQSTGAKILRIGKVVFASYAVAVGVTILIFVIGLFIVGFETIDKLVFGNVRVLVPIVTIVAIPFVSKYLK
jgi:hypothetical protein